ncbi:MAG: ATP-binding protein [Balneolaceae bacterium]
MKYFKRENRMSGESSVKDLHEQNRELKSVNKKYKSEVETLKKRNNELEDIARDAGEQKEFADFLFHTLREGFLVLHEDFRIKMANSAFCELFKVKKEETEGQILFELGNNQWDIPDLRNLLEKVLPENNVVNDYEIEHQFENIGTRVMLLNARQIDHIKLILLAIEDATERKKAMQEVNEAKNTLKNRVEERNKQVHELAKRLTGSEQKERKRISNILHDDLQQLLTAIRMNLKLVSQDMEPNARLSEHMADIINMTDTAIGKTRQLTEGLNPSVLKTQQLSEMLDWIAQRFYKMYDLQTELQPNVNFLIHDKDLRVLLLQIVRECLFNIVKHAETDKAVVEIESAENEMIIRIIDDGIGFDPDEIESKETFGLTNIRERLNLFGGKLKIDSAPGHGCRMKIHIPLKGESISVS